MKVFVMFFITSFLQYKKTLHHISSPSKTQLKTVLSSSMGIRFSYAKYNLWSLDFYNYLERMYYRYKRISKYLLNSKKYEGKISGFSLVTVLNM